MEQSSPHSLAGSAGLFHALRHTCMWEWEIGTGAQSWGEGLWELYGLDPACTEPSHEAWLGLVHPGEREWVDAETRKAIAGGNVFTIEWRIGTKQGDGRRFMTKGVPLDGYPGKPLRYIGIVVDMAGWERVAWTTAAREVYETIPGTFSIMDAEGHLLGWNRNMRKDIVAESDGELSGIEGFELVHPGDREYIRQMAASIMGEGVEVDGEGRFLINGGPAYVWRRVAGRRVFIDGKPCLMAVGVDITRRKRLESLLESRLRLIQMAETAGEEALFQAMIDEVEVLTDSSSGSCLYRGADRNGAPLPMLSTRTGAEGGMGVLFRDPGIMAAIWAEAEREPRPGIHNATGDCSAVFEACRGLDGIARHLVVPYMAGDRLQVLCLLAGKPFGYTEDDVSLVGKLVDLAWDIVARKRAEAAEGELRERLLHSQKLEVLGRLAGGVAHDYNNMLSLTIGHAEMALEHLASGHPAYASMMAIIAATRRSADLVSQLLAFARKQDVRQVLCGMNAAVEACLPMLDGAIGRSIRIDWQPSAQELQIRIDPGQFDQVLLNLCINARDAIAAQGTITISTEEYSGQEGGGGRGDTPGPGRYALLMVTDTGSGIDKDDLPRIFEPFFTSKPYGKGTGLGLSTVYGILTQNGGTIACTSQPGKGTTFRAYFPIGNGVLATADPGDAAGSEIAEQELVDILLVEDEPDILRLVQAVLEKKGYRVTSVPDAESALALSSRSFGLLLTDIRLPGMDGIKLAERMQAADPAMSAIFMSGYASADLFGTILSKGENFIQKPFSLAELVAMIHRRLCAGKG